MTKKLMILLSVLFLIGCAPQGEEGMEGQQTQEIDADQARQQIEERNREMVAAFNSKDYAAMTEFYTEDGISMPSYKPMMRGKEAIRQAGEEQAAAEGGPEFSNLQFTTQDVEVAGDLAVEVGTYSIDITTPDGQAMTDQGKYLTVWKNVDGAWMMHREIWNTDNPPPGMPESGGQQ